MSLANRLQREIKASPAKAAGLGLLVILAGYLWLPMVRNLVAPETAAAPPAAQNKSKTTSETVSTAAAPTKAKQDADDKIDYDWRAHAKKIDADASLRATVELPGARDPFAVPAPVEPPSRRLEEPTVVGPPPSPAEAGLTLSTTLLGASKKIANINGKSYNIGDLVEVGEDPVEASFRVVEIHPGRVVLGDNGDRYELTISRPLVDAARQSAAKRQTVGTKTDAGVRQVHTSDPAGQGRATEQPTN